MTIPSLVAQNQQRAWDKASSIFNRRLGEALKVMNSQQTLAGHQTTRSFLNELSKHIKITKICDSDKLINCFVDEITAGSDTIKTNELKKSYNLNQYSDYDTETLGVQFADGISALIAYNPQCKQDSYNNQIIQFIVQQKSNGNEYSAEYSSKANTYVTLTTDALSILYDVSGNKSPNQYDYNKDIRGLNVSILKSLQCTQINNGKCVIEGTYSWQLAKNICKDLGLKVPSLNEMHKFIKEDNLDGFPTSSSFWTTTEAGSSQAYLCELDGGYIVPGTNIFSGCGSARPYGNPNPVVCIEP